LDREARREGGQKVTPTNPGQTPGRWLASWFGWPPASFDLGDIRGARGAEMYLPLWIQMMRSFGHPFFNVNVVMGSPPKT
jgi:hypothetical protein